MELYVAKELKDKIEPIHEILKERKDEFDELSAKTERLAQQIQDVDKHYNGVAKAMLTKQGIMLDQINEVTILREFKRISDKEALAKERLKRDQSSISP